MDVYILLFAVISTDTASVDKTGCMQVCAHPQDLVCKEFGHPEVWGPQGPGAGIQQLPRAGCVLHFSTVRLEW